MAVTLAEAQINVQDDVDFAVIDNLRRYSWLLDQIAFDDVVNPTGGGTLTYGYTRLVTPAAAAFRHLNEEFVVNKASRSRLTASLSPLGGKFELDRVLARLGQGATNEVTFQLQQLLVAIRTRFQQEMILGVGDDTGGTGDAAGTQLGFDGLDTVLAGTDTEYLPHVEDPTGTGADHLDWSAGGITDEAAAYAALDALDEFLSRIVPSQTGGGTGSPDGLPPGQRAILGNTRSITRVRSIARRAGMYTATKDDLGRHVEMYGPWNLVDVGNVVDGSAPIIPIETRDPGGDTTTTDNLTDLYAVTFGMDSFHAASVAGKPILETWMPDWTEEGAVKRGEVEMGPVAAVLKNTKAAAVLRNVKV